MVRAVGNNSHRSEPNFGKDNRAGPVKTLSNKVADAAGRVTINTKGNKLKPEAVSTKVPPVGNKVSSAVKNKIK